MLWAFTAGPAGSPLLDCDANGRYNPFRTAQREPFEEATGPLLPDMSWITFFGLARTFKQGAVPVPLRRAAIADHRVATPVASAVAELESRGLIGIPFTIDAVTQRIVQRYRDQIGQRGLSFEKE